MSNGYNNYQRRYGDATAQGNNRTQTQITDYQAFNNANASAQERFKYGPRPYPSTWIHSQHTFWECGKIILDQEPCTACGKTFIELAKCCPSEGMQPAQENKFQGTTGDYGKIATHGEASAKISECSIKNGFHGSHVFMRIQGEAASDMARCMACMKTYGELIRCPGYRKPKPTPA